MAAKEKIFYSRQYRYLKQSKTKSILYLIILVVPAYILLFINIKNISGFMSLLGVRVLGRYFPGIPMQIVESQIGLLGKVKYIDLPTVHPNMPLIFFNLIITMFLIFLFSTGRRKGRITSVFLSIVLFTHLINCVYFIFAFNYFPYSTYQYSDLYMKQQIGIWVAFIILTGVLTAFMGRLGLPYKIFTFLGTMLYSIVFGITRYILFLYILQRFSILYMALMFFVFGPFFDFLYLVGIYSVFANKMVKLYSTSEGEREWAWS